MNAAPHPFRPMHGSDACWECDEHMYAAIHEQPGPTQIKSAYRDAEGWVLFDAQGEPVDWPAGWPNEIDVAFLRERGIEVAA